MCRSHRWSDPAGDSIWATRRNSQILPSVHTLITLHIVCVGVCVCASVYVGVCVCVSVCWGGGGGNW